MLWQTPLKPSLSEPDQSQANAIHQTSKFITVTCRLKPLFNSEEKSKIEIDTISHAITLNDPTKSISKTYSFDQIFDQTVEQDHFTNTVCQPLVGFLKNGGQSGLIFSYGITNSGKTYTILGTKQKPGILLTLIKKLEQEFKEQTLRIVACELYKDEFFSLKTKGEKLHPKELRGTFTFDECHSDIINQNNMEELFSQYLTNRSCSSTSYNTISSRSHAIFKIISKKFRIGVVDLAGSQRSAKGNDNGTDIKETIFINSSLLTLKKCIKSLEQKSQMSHKICIPYRESKLTQSLVEYFVPNSKINIIVNINQARHCLEQNLNVMDYTSKTKNITANVMSDFSQMLKSTARKKEEMIVAVKSYKVVKSSNKKNIFGVEVNKGVNLKTTTFGKKAGVNIFSSSKEQKFIQPQQHSSQKSFQSQQFSQHNKSLESIEQQTFNEQHKKSQHVSTTVCSTQLACSNILIQEIQYNEFNPQKRQNEHKIRYSVQFVGEDHKYIIEEEMIQNQQLQKSLQIQIQKQERKSFIESKQNQQTFEQFVQKTPLTIEDFIIKQQEFRNYLAFDRKFEAEDDARKLSELKKVNLFQTTKKKQFQLEKQQQSKQSETMSRQSSQLVELMDISIGTDEQIHNNRRTTDLLNQTIENMDFDKLKTNVKRKLLDMLKDDQKKRLVNEVEKQSAKKYQSIKKGQSKSLNKKLNIFEMDQTELENDQSNYTTPSKNIRKQNNHLNCSQSQQKHYPSVNSQVSQSILKKTFDKVASGVKSGVQFMADKVGLGAHIFKTNTKVTKSLSQQKVKKNNPLKAQMNIWNEISEVFEPQNKLQALTYASQQVQVTSSIKKVRFDPSQFFLIEDDKISYPELKQKEIQVMVFEVATQTEDVESKFVLENVIDEVIHEQRHEQRKKKNFKKNKRAVKNEENIQKDNLSKQDLKKQDTKRKQLMQKTAFKCISVRKEMGHSLKKRPQILSNSKSVIAHKTRGARRKNDRH